MPPIASVCDGVANLTIANGNYTVCRPDRKLGEADAFPAYSDL
jgi:uncharacterized protein (DUF779 family)